MPVSFVVYRRGSYTLSAPRGRERGMVRAFVLYEGETPDPARYEQHNRDFSEQGAGRDVPARRGLRRRLSASPIQVLLRVRVADIRVQGRHAQREFAAAGKDAMEMDPVQRLLRGVVTRDRADTSRGRVDPAELGFERIVYEKAPPARDHRLNRPEVLNAFDFQTLRELARACEDASWDDSIRVVVLTGTGRAFCVGADSRSGRGVPRQPDGVLEVVRRVQRCARPAARDRQADGGAINGIASAAATSCRWPATWR